MKNGFIQVGHFGVKFCGKGRSGDVGKKGFVYFLGDDFEGLKELEAVLSGLFET
jgi:hypothetical protein